MRTWRFAAGASLLPLGLMLAACGGGGVSSTPTPTPGTPTPTPGTPTPSPTPTPGTPTPTPSTGANDDLLPTLVSESFTNRAASGSAGYTLDSSPKFTSKQVTATISYNASNQSYTLNVDGRSISFSSSDIDLASSNAGATVYTRESGDRTDTLTLTKPGTSGPITYRYVGSAFWERIDQTDEKIDARFDALVYGVETPNGSVPHTGQAYYTVDLIGSFAQTDTIGALVGSGSMEIDLASGGLATQIDFGSGNGWFSGTGSVSSSGNQLSGTFSANVVGGAYTGNFNGMFFGPNADEVGAAFYSNPSSTGSFVGTIMGRKGSTGSNKDFNTLVLPQFFTSSDRRRVVFDKNGNNAVTLVSKSSSPITIGYQSTAEGGKYNFFLGDGVKSLSVTPDQTGLDTSSTLTYAGLSNYIQSFPAGWLQYDGNFQYMRAGRLVTRSGNRFTFDEFIFGMPSARSALPTGTAAYGVDLSGTLFAKTGAPVALAGAGNLTANFSTGQIVATGAVANHADSADVIGTYHGTASLASGAASFNGSFSVDDGSIDYNGDWDGSFFGPQGQEVGSSFLADGTDGSVMSGVIIGKRDDGLLGFGTPLGELETTTHLGGSYAYVASTGGSPTFVNGFVNPVDITYNPASGSYHMVVGEGAGNVPYGAIDAEFDDGDKVSGQSNSSYNVYHTADVDAEVLNFGAGTNPVIELSYTSLAHVRQTWMKNGDPLLNEYWVAFGEVTPNNRMPHSGSATYHGIAQGGGYVDGIGQGAKVSGTMTAQMNFGTLALTSSFALTAKDPNGVLADVNLGTQTATGEVSGNGFGGGNTAGTFGMNGYFFGPGVEEIGGTFHLDIDGPIGSTYPNGIDVTGGFVGK